MATQIPLVVISGQIQQLPSGDTISGVPASGAVSNLISSVTAIAADTSYIVASYLDVVSDLTVSGNLMVTG